VRFFAVLVRNVADEPDEAADPFSVLVRSSFAARLAEWLMLTATGYLW
jgi:hypothetical protein